MRKSILCVVALCAVLVAANVATAGNDVPHRFAPWSLDRGLATAQNPVDGRTVAVWSYRSAGQYDIAISFRDAGAAFWSEPVFIGSADGIQQEQPSIAADAAGNLYVAYLVRETGHIFMTTLARGSENWSAPVAVTAAPGRRSAPLVRLIAGRLVIAFRTLTGVDLIELAPLETGVGTQGVQDGPDTLPREKTPPSDGDDGSLTPKR